MRRAVDYVHAGDVFQVEVELEKEEPKPTPQPTQQTKPPVVNPTPKPVSAKLGKFACMF